ncbi:MAG: PIN domain-containing protein [Ferrovum myxofaciens]|uniref:PIN domain-containing protein n=1 Tax=Ferrovum myxofaciens TaxID=416213 RepID=A0A9E6N0M6_9PROT|nr:MAG: PIN domain-containing protein [Ferrovum myxofaciens]QWY75912.1 MAG: PIN domain-containing protein [Ferrovum myxofaciens]QWY78642.1 MAG: PIN domain-containing protein [Ferrovum myxofaciens]
MRAVIDTNILVSALLTPSGVPAQLIAAIRTQALTPVISESIIVLSVKLRRLRRRYKEKVLDLRLKFTV